MSRSATVWLLVVAVATGLVVAGFLAAFERIAEEREVGFGGEARRNPLLALERLAAGLEVDAERPRDPLRLPPADHVLLALGAHHPPGPAYLDELLAWVAAGGHLVFVPAAGGDGATSVEPLLDRLAITALWPPAGSAPSGGGEETGASEGDAGDSGAVAARGAVAAPIGLRVSPGATVRRVAMPPWPAFVTASASAHLSGPEDRASLVVLAWGAGRVTVLADAGFLGNDEIGRLDHASFAWDLLAAAGRPAGLAIVDWRRAMPLSAIVAGRGWPLAAAAALLVIAWIVFRGGRFGPPLADGAPPRRSLLEHLQANGDFLWRHDQGGVLLAACRAALARRLELAHSEWSRQPEAERVRRLALFTDLPAGTVAAALEGDAADGAEFTRTVATLERLRRSS